MRGSATGWPYTAALDRKITRQPGAWRAACSRIRAVTVTWPLKSAPGSRREAWTDEGPAARREQGVTVEEGVSCESCHGAGSGWIRLHTRKDTTRAQRVAAGMRDLEDLYLRANTCVACHQAIEPALVAAGHPPLELELEAHQRREPRHWKELWGGGSTWLTGQAAAAWELAGRLATGQGGPADAARLEAVLWVVKLAAAHAPGGLKVPEVSTRPTHDEVRALDRLAKAAAAQAWSPAQEAAAREALDAAGKGLGREAAPRRQALDAALLALAPRP